MDFIEFCLAFTGWETANKYKITNTQGQQVFFAAEGNIYMYIHAISWFLPILVVTLHNFAYGYHKAGMQAPRLWIDLLTLPNTGQAIVKPDSFLPQGTFKSKCPSIVLLAYERKFIFIAMFLFKLVHNAWPGLWVIWVDTCPMSKRY